MSQWVLTGNGYIMPIQTLRQLTPSERSSLILLKRMKEFDEHNKKKYGDSMNIPTDQYLSRDVYPEHDDEKYNADSGEV